MSVPETMPSLINMKRLWVHEILRVFGDRLVNEEDLNWLIGQLHSTVKKHMGNDMTEMFKDLLSKGTKKVKNKMFE